MGCGAALPTPHHFCSTQVVNVRDKLFMVDCAEGIQMQLRRSRLKFSTINNIFITHLHGDHCFGLLPLISTFGLLGRTATLNVWGPKGLCEVFEPQIRFFCQGMNYEVKLNEIDPKVSGVIYEDRSVKVVTLPLNHRMPCCGYMFCEKPTLKHIRRDAIDAFGIPTYFINSVKAGMDFVTPDAEVVPNHLLTTPADPVRSYAYVSDTKFKPELSELLRGVDLLYHEATFLSEQEPLARHTFHSTAAQAGEIARLAEAKKLMIGHFSSRYTDENVLLDESKKVFPNTILAKEGLCVKL